MASVKEALKNQKIMPPRSGKLLPPNHIFSMLTSEFIELEEGLTAHNYSPLMPVLVRGKGAVVIDIDDNEYYDMLGAYSSQNQGHNHPKIHKVIKEMLGGDYIATPSRAFRHAFFGYFLKKVTTISEMERFLPMNTGAEAVETAMKVMLKYAHDKKGIGQITEHQSYGRRTMSSNPEIIFMEGNFHGRTRAIVGASTDPDAYTGFGPQMPGTVIVPYGDINALEMAIAENTVGVMLEPIQGEAGVIIPPAGYLTQVRELTRERDILMCLDEVQTGFGRTGYDFAWMAEPDSKPDIVVMGKALSGGMYPISGIACSSEIMDVFTPGTHGSTYGGNALACMIGAAALDVIFDENLSEQSLTKGKWFKAKLEELAYGHPHIKEVRGRGLMTAVEFYKPIAHDVAENLVFQGILAKDTHSTTIRFTPPLVITMEQLEDAYSRIASALDEERMDTLY